MGRFVHCARGRHKNECCGCCLILAANRSLKCRSANSVKARTEWRNWTELTLFSFSQTDQWASRASSLVTLADAYVSVVTWVTDDVRQCLL